MPRVVLIGHGIGYSASPAMHAAAFAAAGLDWSYELLDVPAERLPEAVAEVRASCIGANVTIPHKVPVGRLLDDLDDGARAAGAVNTIRRDGERLIGSNTDVAGILAALGAVGVEATGARAVVLGAGGSARAAAAALAGARITVVARRPEAASDLPGTVVDWRDEPSWGALVRHADLLVNATPLGRREEMPVRPACLPPRGAVIDLVYVAGGTPLVRRARRLGLRCVDGWDVLVAQGAAAFQTWTGRPAPVEAMRTALGAGAGLSAN
jgi:shikimate dehydrogenase